MKLIYLKNYIRSREEKLNFIKFLRNTDKLRLLNQRVIFGENALLLDFKYRRVEEKHRAFFYTTLEISVHVVDQIIEDKDSLILEFNNKKLRVKH